MTPERDVTLRDGRTLRANDSGAPDAPVLIWQHGSPHTGAVYEPLVSMAAEVGFRLVSYARPNYGGSSPLARRDVASAAGDVEQLADALGVNSFVTMGSSGGGPHALACAALLPNRVAAVATLASPAPYTDAFDWYAGMRSDGALRSARAGHDARARYGEAAEFDPETFIPADWAALEGAWKPMIDDVAAALAAGADGLIDDDVALAQPWGFEPDSIAAPALVVQGQQDRMIPPSHALSLHAQINGSELWMRRLHGHVSLLADTAVAMEWLIRRL